jgi:hypothetical protein
MPEIPLSTTEQLEQILEDKLAATVVPIKKPKAKGLPKIALKVQDYKTDMKMHEFKNIKPSTDQVSALMFVAT